MGFFNFFTTRTRIDIIEDKALSIVDAVTQDLNDFTPVEQAKIINLANIEFVKRLTIIYNESYNSQQEVLAAKELIK